MENHLNKTNLVRIRIKHDPANGIGEMNDYVGYVLEEDGSGNIIAIVPGMGSETMSLGPEQYDIESPCGGQQPQQDPLAQFKKHIVDYLMVRGYHDKVSEHMDVLINAKHVTELEKLVQTCGCDGMAILNMYRDYVSNGAIQ